ncbi:MAG: glycine/betaine/sarcosine/D-proline family reductase selenoprotein B [Chloroflexota bacterium]|nr:MAG: glycine/betaine/sarcosine/D-proline family reductase selenoprotein B [Chloroflexota bacterium]
MNQFFAGIGGEDTADAPVDFRKGTLGPGKRLQTLLGDSAKIVVTTYCGDNYFAAQRDEALEKILQIARDNDVKILVAGPAFASGRYGFTCVEVCQLVSTSLGLDCVIGLHSENAALDGYRQYKNRRVFAIPVAREVSGMETALQEMAKFVSKLATGSTIGSAIVEGYIPRGIRVVRLSGKSGVDRAVEMLLNQHYGRPISTEIPVESLEKIPIPPRVTDLTNVCLALVTEAGIVPLGNPDGFRTHRNTQWGKYSIERMNSMKEAAWEIRHGGWDISAMSGNHNFGVPLDVCRKMERQGLFQLYPYFYSLCGNNGAISDMQRIGRSMAQDMKTAGVAAAILVST